MSSADHIIKLHSSLKFDPIKEKDIIDKVEEMAGSRELTYYITNLLKYALDNPEVINDSGISKAGYQISKAREDYFRQLDSKISEMKDKIDKIYNMADRINSLVLLGKSIGIEDRNRNILQTQFLLQRQLKELSDTLGVSMTGKTFESNKLAQYDEKASEFIEYVIEHYDGIINEIANNRVKVVEESLSANIKAEYTQKEIIEHQGDAFKKKEEIELTTPIKETLKSDNIKNTSMGNDEDFGDDDMDIEALGDFFST